MATELDREWGRAVPSDEEPIAGNTPRHLDSPATLWLVTEGKVEVFAVPRGTDGPRTHLMTATTGALLGGLERGHQGSGLGLLAVGAPAARLRRLGEAEVRRLAREPAGAAELAARLDGWLAGLGGGIARTAAPKLFAELRSGEETDLAAAGSAARLGHGVAWVRAVSGRVLLLGEEDLALTEGEVVPLPEALWLVACGTARVSSLATYDLLRSDHGLGRDLWPGLARFHELCLAAVRLASARAERQDRERLLRKQELDHIALLGAYTRLAGVLERAATDGAGLDDGLDPLVGACRLAGEAQGITITARPESSPGASQGDLLGQICRASRIRCRRVILRDDWWRRDNGPLVAFKPPAGEGQARRPVALLPASPASYDVVDPAAHTRMAVDAAVSESLDGDAYQLYAPFAARAVTVKDMARKAFAGSRRDLLTIGLMGLAYGLLGLLVPVLTGMVFGSVVPSADRGTLLQITVALIVGAVAGALFQVTRSLAVLRLGGRIDATLQPAVWDRLLALPVAFFRRYTVGDLADRALGFDSIRELLAGNVLTVALAAVFSLPSFLLLFYYSWRLALLATALMVLLVAVAAALLPFQLRHQREILSIQGRIASLLFGLIHGVAKLRVAGAEARAYAHWAERFAAQRRRTLAAQRVANGQAVINAIYGTLASLLIFAVVAWPTTEPPLPVGDFLAFNAAFGQLLAAALALIAVLSSVLGAIPVYERLQPILTTSPEADESKAEPGEIAGDVEFSHVQFRYQEGGPLVVSDISFRAGAGEFIALVGPSGAGKSTCLRLILGFEKPTAGSIYFDGQDLAGLAVQAVRRQIGVVLQHGRPLAGSIYSNIVGSSNLGIDAAWEAARAAGLEDDVRAMPMGLHTVVSEGAETFSGGQRQRLLIARALVHRPRILLFDEATSALDNHTQEVVSRSLERLKATRIVIAHRLSTIERADRIYLLDGGHVVEEGRYEELLRKGGAFARLAERQML